MHLYTSQDLWSLCLDFCMLLADMPSNLKLEWPPRKFVYGIFYFISWNLSFENYPRGSDVTIPVQIRPRIHSFVFFYFGDFSSKPGTSPMLLCCRMSIRLWVRIYTYLLHFGDSGSGCSSRKTGIITSLVQTFTCLLLSQFYIKSKVNKFNLFISIASKWHFLMKSPSPHKH